MHDLTQLSKEQLRKVADDVSHYTDLLIVSTEYFQKLYDTNRVTSKIVKKASALADKFEEAPKIDLRNYR